MGKISGAGASSPRTALVEKVRVVTQKLVDAFF
jgi:hypothetical protein